jgi:hypothetical protein
LKTVSPEILAMTQSRKKAVLKNCMISYQWARVHIECLLLFLPFGRLKDTAAAIVCSSILPEDIVVDWEYFVVSDIWG